MYVNNCDSTPTDITRRRDDRAKKERNFNERKNATNDLSLDLDEIIARIAIVMTKE